MDESMDVLETGPGLLADAVLMQQVVTQVQHSQMNAAPQCLLCRLFNQIFIHLEVLKRRTQTDRDI